MAPVYLAPEQKSSGLPFKGMARTKQSFQRVPSASPGTGKPWGVEFRIDLHVEDVLALIVTSDTPIVVGRNPLDQRRKTYPDPSYIPRS